MNEINKTGLICLIMMIFYGFLILSSPNILIAGLITITGLIGIIMGKFQEKNEQAVEKEKRKIPCFG